MEHISIGLIFCMITELSLIQRAIRNMKEGNWEEKFMKVIDYFSVFLGIPIFVGTLLLFIFSTI